MRRKVFVLIGSGVNEVISMFEGSGYDIVEHHTEADLVVFTGGADVTPSLYGQYTHSLTSSDSGRDEREKAIYLECLDLGIPMAGICRGGQFLNIMNGGRMWQHVDGHAKYSTHEAFINGQLLPVKVTSTHHQMMVPDERDDCIILMTAGESTRKEGMSDVSSGVRYGISRLEANKHQNDIEAVFYGDNNCLCFQPHPEFDKEHARETREVFFHFLNNYTFMVDGASDEEELLIDEG